MATDNWDGSEVTVSKLPQGTTTFNWHVEYNGCEKDAQVQITNNSVDLAKINYPGSGQVCDAQFNMGAEAPAYGKGVWTRQGQATFSSSTNNVVTVSGLVPNSQA